MQEKRPLSRRQAIRLAFLHAIDERESFADAYADRYGREDPEWTERREIALFEAAEFKRHFTAMFGVRT